MPTSTYVVSIDWNANDVFTDSGEDITADVIEMSWRCGGRDYASQLVGRSTSGFCSLTVTNETGKYNSFNSASALYGNLLPGRKIKITMDGVAMFRGFLDTIEPLPHISGIHRAIIRGIGPFAYIAQRKVSIALQQNKTTDQLIGTVLTEAGWPAGDTVNDAGLTTLKWFQTGGKVDVLSALREIEAAEFGFINENKSGQIVFHNRHHRMNTSVSTTSQATLTDAPAGALRYNAIKQMDPLKEVFNIIEATVRGFTVQASAVLWTLPEAAATNDSPPIDVGETKVFWAQYPNPQSPAQASFVSAWTTLVATTDYLAFDAADGTGENLTANCTVVLTKFDNAMKISISHNAVRKAYVTFLQARGTPVYENDPTVIKAEDSTSKTKYGERTFPIGSRWIPTTDEATDYTNFILGIYKDPRPILRLTINAEMSAAALSFAANREVADRVTVVASGAADLGISADFFIEAQTHRVTNGGKSHKLELDVSPTDGFGGFWSLGNSLLGVDTKLAY